jgi:hypothetical protein
MTWFSYSIVQYSGEMREPRGGVGDTFSPELFGMTFEGSYTVYDSKGRKEKEKCSVVCVCVSVLLLNWN